MKTIKIRSGGQAFVLDKDETCPPGAICFLFDEWEWALKLSKSYVSDPEQLQAFWGTLIERKQSLPGYCIYMDFPKEQEKSKKDLTICKEILQMLSKHKKMEE